MKKPVQVYMAPLEGITKYVYRNAHNEIFGGVSKYFAPFIDARINRPLKSREINDLLPENNQNLSLIPQIMTNNSEAFLATAAQLRGIGYHEINLNLGCPSLTVVRKHRGSGFLNRPNDLKQFFQDVYNDSSFSSGDMKLSVKTRLGVESPDEMYVLLNIYNQFPLHELIVHPRVQTDYYKNTPNLEMFHFIRQESQILPIYNGDLNSVSDVVSLTERFPNTDTLMIGRGLIRDPAFARQINTADNTPQQNQLQKRELLAFHDSIYHAYQELLSGELPVLHKMKELWSYWIVNFADAKKPYKELNKSQTFKEYESRVTILFSSDWCV
ncbi:MAG: tRNA-dihydrouridine synthase family protein [Hespellia sp.]|nr:tRNA-dihydrouridine synthase family protein [Hespellia sp.]